MVWAILSVMLTTHGFVDASWELVTVTRVTWCPAKSISSQTIVPTTYNQYIYSGNYLSGNQTIQGDSNLISSNIKSGVSIFGVYGTYSGSSSIGNPKKVDIVTSSNPVYANWGYPTTYTCNATKTWSYTGLCTMMYIYFTFASPSCTTKTSGSLSGTGKISIDGTSVTYPEVRYGDMNGMSSYNEAFRLTAQNGVLSFNFLWSWRSGNYFTTSGTTCQITQLYIYTM